MTPRSFAECLALMLLEWPELTAKLERDPGYLDALRAFYRRYVALRQEPAP